MSVTNPSVHELISERMMPETADLDTFWEHVYRYSFAVGFVKGKRVLDIASGEGYGTASLRKAGAASVVGVDVSEEACQHARKKYGIETRLGNAEQIPLGDASVDVLVSFETIEHVPNPQRFLDECVRVLAPGGRVIISTPRKGAFKMENPFHISEMTQEEFMSGMLSRFHDCQFYSQRPISVAWWSARSLACDDTPWKHIRGFSRLRHAIRSIWIPEAMQAPTREQRESALDLIAGFGKSSWSLFNPYVLRPYRKRNGEKPTYFIATAIR